jgi:hypothetical protein
MLIALGLGVRTSFGLSNCYMNHCTIGNLFFSLELEIFYMEHTTNTINILFSYHNVSTILLIKLALISKYRDYTNSKNCYNMDVLQSILNMVLQHKLVANSTTISIRKHMVRPLCKPLILQWYHYSGFLVGLMV